MVFTKQHYEALAELIYSNTDRGGHIYAPSLIDDLAEYFEQDNKHFDKKLWKVDCITAKPF